MKIVLFSNEWIQLWIMTENCVRNFSLSRKLSPTRSLLMTRSLFVLNLTRIYITEKKKKERKEKHHRRDWIRSVEINDLKIRSSTISIVFVTVVSRVRSPLVPWRVYVPCIFLLSACTFSFIIHGKLAMNHLLRRSAQVQIYRCLFERSVGRCCVSHALLIVTRGEITRVRLDSSFQPLSRGRRNVTG